MDTPTMIDEVLVRARIDEYDQVVTREAALAHLNSAVRRYQGDRSWPWLDHTNTVPLVAGTAVYVTPGNTLAVRGVRYRVTAAAQPLNLVQVGVRELADLPVSEGEPRWYALDGDLSVEVRPYPATSGGYIDLLLTLTEDPLEDVTDNEPELPVPLRDVLVDHAVRAAFLSKGNVEEASTVAPIDSDVVRARLLRAASLRRGAPRVRRRYP